MMLPALSVWTSKPAFFMRFATNSRAALYGSLSTWRVHPSCAESVYVDSWLIADSSASASGSMGRVLWVLGFIAPELNSGFELCVIAQPHCRSVGSFGIGSRS